MELLAHTDTRDRYKATKKSAQMGSPAVLPGFAKKLFALLEEIKDTQAEHGKQISHLALRMEACIDPGRRSECLLPEEIELPINTVEQLQDLEEKLHDHDLRKKLVGYLSSIGGDSSREALRRIMRRVFSTALAMQYNLSGVKGKRGFKDLTLKQVVFSSVRQLFPATTEAELESHVALWLCAARDRDGGRQRRSLHTTTAVLAQSAV